MVFIYVGRRSGAYFQFGMACSWMHKTINYVLLLIRFL